MEIRAAMYGWDSLAASAALIRRPIDLPTTGTGRLDRPRLAYTVSAFHRDRSGTLWLGTWGGVLSRFDEKTEYLRELYARIG